MINKAILIGNIGADPEIRTLENGVKLARMRLATTERFKGQDGKPQELTEWHNIEAWRGLADVADRYVRKGDRLYICGSIHYREYDGKDGVKRMAVTIRADEMKILSPKEVRATAATPAPSDTPTAAAASPIPPAPDFDDLPF